MNFIDGQPPSKGKIVVLVVADWLSKYAHFIPMSHPYTTQGGSKIFYKYV